MKESLQRLKTANKENLVNAINENVDTKINKAGDTMTGDLDMGTNRLVIGEMAWVYNATTQSMDLVVK